MVPVLPLMRASRPIASRRQVFDSAWKTGQALLTFDNAARSSPPPTGGTVRLPNPARGNRGTNRTGVNRAAALPVGDLLPPNPSANPVGDREGKESAFSGVQPVCLRPRPPGRGTCRTGLPPRPLGSADLRHLRP